MPHEPRTTATPAPALHNESAGTLDGEPTRIAVLRALQLGDLLVAVPALRALRARFPSSRITLISLPWARAFVERYRAYLDDFLEFPGWPGLPERELATARVPAFLAEAQRERFDLAIQLHGSGSRVNEIVGLLGARRSAGFFRDGDHVPDDALFVRWPEAGREGDRLLALVRHLGGDAANDANAEPEFPLDGRDEAELGAVPEVSGISRGGYVCIHPGARFRSRRWPAHRFAAVADALHARGLRVVLTGSEDEREVTTAVRHAMRVEPIDVTGRLTLGALGALLSRAALVVSNDTGVSHVAAGVGTPSVVIASGSDAERWAPGVVSRHRVLWHALPCRPCTHRDCPIGHPCALAIEADAVIAEADRLLAVRGA